ncbi:hypothetical protein BC835DRAFT_149643 [Cytidiella melzeri]|nr:hypothetical protein BC835DRAFT_149643 [Cytidiella melzeri]
MRLGISITLIILQEKRDVAPRPSNPPPKITGSNNTPIGDRRPTREHSGGRDSPAGPEANRYRQQPSPIYSEAEKSRYPDDLSRAPSRSASYHSGSPVDRLKVLPPVTEPSSRWPDARISKDFPSPPPHHPPSPRLSPADLDSNRMARKDAAERSVRTTRFGPGPDQILPATDTQPRKWLTREEAERSGLAVQTPSTSTGRSFNARPPSPSAPSSRDERRLHEAGRQADDKGRRSFEDPAGKQRTFETFGSRREETRTDNSPGDRPVTERPSLEGRLSSTRGRDAVSFEDRLLDRSAVDESERATIKTHPDRARFLVSSPQLSEPLAFTNGARSSHTSKSRRKGRPFEQNGGVSVSQDDHDTLAESKDSDVQRAAPDSPPARPGATLLDRLTEPTTDRSSPSSLRDRVHPPVSGIAGLPPRPPAELSYDAINSNDGGSKGGRGPPRRRSAKPRKGRKVDETKVHEAGLPR